MPLFVEELTRAMLESGVEAPAALSSVPHQALAVPATLHASLMARLDRLGPAAKDVAQTGAAIGREFAYELLASVIDLSPPQLHGALDRLTNAGLLFARGAPPDASYIFKHALVQDAAYGTLLRRRRQGLHAGIAATLEDRFPEIVMAQPALLGHHYAEAGLVKRSIDNFLRATRQAIARSETLEAEAQLRRGLNLLASLPEGTERQQRELDLQIALVVTLMQTRGYAAPAVAETVGRARQLCEQLNQPPQLAHVLYVQCGYRILRGELPLACQNAMEHLRLGEDRNDPVVKLTACLNAASAWGLRGDFVTARAYAEQMLELHDPARSAVIATISPQIPELCAPIYLARALYYLGFLDQARVRYRRSTGRRAQARSCSHTGARPPNLVRV